MLLTDIVPKENHELYLIRFEEKLYPQKDLHGIVDIKWQLPFIPVVGIELNKQESNEILNRISKVPSVNKIKPVDKFTRLSFLEI